MDLRARSGDRRPRWMSGAMAAALAVGIGCEGSAGAPKPKCIPLEPGANSAATNAARGTDALYPRFDRRSQRLSTGPVRAPATATCSCCGTPAASTPSSSASPPARRRSVRSAAVSTRRLPTCCSSALPTAPPAPRCVLSLPSTAAMLRSPSRCSLAPLLGREVCASPLRTPLPPLCGSAAAPCSCPRPWC